MVFQSFAPTTEYETGEYPPPPAKIAAYQVTDPTFVNQAPVVQHMNRAIHRTNLFAVDNTISFPNTYPFDSDLSGGTTGAWLTNKYPEGIWLWETLVNLLCGRVATSSNFSSLFSSTI